MINLSIVVEGKEDKRFLEALIEKRFKPEYLNQIEFVNNNGKDIPASKAAIIKRRADNSPTIIIFDADNKDYASTIKYLEKQTKNYELPIKNTFLFPNNSEDGNLETLLGRIIPSQYKRFLDDCIDSYASCVNALSNKELRVSSKDQLYIYRVSIAKSKKEEAEKRINYKDNTLRNLESKELDSLINFLTPYFQEWN